MNIQEALEEARSGGNDICLIESVLAGSPIDTTDEYGETALHQAVQSESLCLVQAILERGARVDVKNKDGWIALHLASLSPNEAIAALLLDHGANVNTKASQGDTPLHGASVEITKMLLDKEADIDSQDNEGNTPLHKAVSYFATDTVALLLHRGAKINIQNSKEYSPLYAALVNDDDNISINKCQIQLLLQYGAYSDLYVKVATQKSLENYWHRTFCDQEKYQSFYTTLLLAGVVVPRNVVLPESLQTIRRHIQETVSTWLEPLALSSEDCAEYSPKALILLPCLGTVARHTLIDLLRTDFSVKETDKQLVEYLVNDSRQHPQDYADFHRKIFTHNWLEQPCAPPGQFKTSTMEVSESSQRLHP